MKNIVEYAMQMKDMMSGPLGNIAKSFDNVSEHASKAEEKASAFSKIAGTAFGLNNILGAAKSAISVASAVGEKIGETMQASLDRQQLQVSFDVLTGSKEAGGKLTKELVDLQKNTILGSEVFKNAQTMLGFGFKDTEVVDNLRMLGDVSMGDAEKLNSLTLAFSQIRSAGKLQGQDLLQLINAGFNPLQEMSKRTGKNVAELKEEMAKGNVSFEMVQQAFKDATSEGGAFNDMLGTIAKTDAGMKAQLGGALDELKIKVGDAFQPLTHLGLELGTKLLPIAERLTVPLAEGVQKAVNGFEILMSKADKMKAVFHEIADPLMNMIDRIKDSMGGFQDYLAPVVDMIENKIWPIATNLWGTLTGIIGDLVEFYSSSMLLKDVFAAIQIVVSSLWDAVGGVVDAVKWLWNNVIMPLLNGIEKAYRWIKGGEMPGGTNKAITATPTIKKEDEKSSPTTKKLEEIAKNTKANASAGASASKAVASSGPKVVNINVTKFFDNIEFNTTSLQESAGKIEEVVLEVLSRVLVQGAAQI